MKFKKFILCLMACILGLSILLPVRTFADNNNLNINAESAILIDNDTGKVLYEKSANEKREPASTTKIMTALLTLENCDLNDIATVTSEAITSVSIRIFYRFIKNGRRINYKRFTICLITTFF